MNTHEGLGYTAIFEPDVEGGFVVYVPALPGCMSQGDTFEEARINIQDAVRGYVSVLKEDGDEVPQEVADSIITRIIAPDPA